MQNTKRKPSAESSGARVLVLGLAVIGLASSSLLAADLETGVRQLEDKQYEQAEDTFRELVSAEPDNLDANYFLGKTLIARDKSKDAIAPLEKAAGEKPEARVSLAHAYLLQDRLDDANRELDAAAESQAENPELYLSRGMIFLKREKFSDAATQLSKAVELDGDNAYAHYYLGMAQSRLKRPDQMLEHFEIFLRLAPNSPEAAKVRSLLRSL
jgi:tetratricopeptide (TPR) repeat protein